MLALVVTADAARAARLERALETVQGLDLAVSRLEDGEAAWPEGVDVCLADAADEAVFVRCAVTGAQAEPPVPVVALVGERAEGPELLRRGAVDYLLLGADADADALGLALERALHAVRLRAQTLRTLRQERAFNDIVLDETDLLVVVTDPEGRVVRFSWAAERATGLTLGEVYGRPLAELHTGAGEAEALAERLADQPLDAFPIRFRQTWTTPAGRRLTLGWSASGIRAEEGGLGAMLLTGQDLTELAHLEELLRSERLLWAQVAGCAPLGIIATDAEGVVVLGVGGALEGLGVDPAAIVGQPAAAVLGGALDGPVRAALEGAVRTTTTALGGRPCRVRAQPLSQPNGAPLGALVVATDLSEPA